MGSAVLAGLGAAVGEVVGAGRARRRNAGRCRGLGRRLWNRCIGRCQCGRHRCVGGRRGLRRLGRASARNERDGEHCQQCQRPGNICTAQIRFHLLVLQDDSASAVPLIEFGSRGIEARALLRASSIRKNGAPTSAVMIPTLTSAGAITSRARVSAASRKTAPPQGAQRYQHPVVGPGHQGAEREARSAQRRRWSPRRPLPSP